MDILISIENKLYAPYRNSVLSRNILLYLFVVTFIAFSFIYFSFFPGHYSPDSYASYIAALGEESYDTLSPFYMLWWKVFGNRNCSPLVVNYLMLIGAMFLFYKKTRSVIILQCILVCFLLPTFTLSYIFAWKDNALISTLVLLIAILFQNRHRRYLTVIFSIFLLAISLRINAIFSIVPLLWWYTGKIITNKSQKPWVFLAIICSMFALNNFITYYVFKAHKVNVIQQTYTSDVIKINYQLNRSIYKDIPSEFLLDISKDNINKVFEQYNLYHNNDYFFYKTNITNPVFQLIGDNNALQIMRNNWIKTVSVHFIQYCSNRYVQWMQAMIRVHNIFGLVFYKEQNSFFDTIDQKYFYPQPKNHLMSSVRQYYSQQNLLNSLFLYIELPIVYFILSCIFYLWLKLYRSNSDPDSFIRSILLSGILYALGYLPILPALDYRYFTWVVLSFWLSLGIYLQRVTFKSQVIKYT